MPNDDGLAEYIAELAATQRAFEANPDWEPRPYLAANGHTMIQSVPGQSWNASCVDDCRACADGDPLPDW